MIPSQLSYLFWDYDLNTINIQTHSNFVAERILEKGDKNAVGWLLSNSNQFDLKNLVLSSRNISEATRNFWMMTFSDDYKKL